MTLLKMSKTEASVVIASSRITEFTDANLEKIMRLFYLNRVVVWPFGRSEIHACIAEQPVHEFSHKFTFTEREK